MREKKSVSMKIVVLLLAVVLLIGCATGGTLAWLIAKTDPIENTFSVANINIALTETPNASSNEGVPNDIWVGKMVPGTNIAKDPKVTVSANSEACWLFVKVSEVGGNVTVGENTYSFDDFVKYSMANGWTALPGETDVYYREVSASASAQEFYVLEGKGGSTLKNGHVSIPQDVTKAMLDAVTKNADETPSLTFTAYAVQKEGFANASAAWTEAKK